MANYSDFTAYFKGEKEGLDKLEKKLKSFVGKNDYGDQYFLGSSDSAPAVFHTVAWDVTFDREDDTSLSMHGTGRWHGPADTLQMFAIEYGVDMEYHDFEPGCYFYHRVIIKDGDVIEDEEYEYISKKAMEFRGYEYYLEEYQWITDEDDVEGGINIIKAIAKAAGVSPLKVADDLAYIDGTKSDTLKKIEEELKNDAERN